MGGDAHKNFPANTPQRNERNVLEAAAPPQGTKCSHHCAHVPLTGSKNRILGNPKGRNRRPRRRRRTTTTSLPALRTLSQIRRRAGFDWFPHLAAGTNSPKPGKRIRLDERRVESVPPPRRTPVAALRRMRSGGITFLFVLLATLSRMPRRPAHVASVGYLLSERVAYTYRPSASGVRCGRWLDALPFSPHFLPSLLFQIFVSFFLMSFLPFKPVCFTLLSLGQFLT